MDAKQLGDMPLNGSMGNYGITLRQHFAGLAMQGFCANPSIFAPNGMRGWGLVNATEEVLADYALDIADALLAELAKET